jgi:hypothetical protein
MLYILLQRLAIHRQGMLQELLRVYRQRAKVWTLRRKQRCLPLSLFPPASPITTSLFSLTTTSLFSLTTAAAPLPASPNVAQRIIAPPGFLGSPDIRCHSLLNPCSRFSLHLL